MNILTNEDIPLDLWSEYVNSHEEGNLFQTPEMYATYKDTKNYLPFAIACLKGEELSAVMLSVVQKEHAGIAGSFSARSISIGGPLFSDKDSLDLIISEYDNAMKSKVIYSEIRNMFSPENKAELLASKNYSFEEHLNILVDLSKGEKGLWSDIHPRRRTNINKGTKEGFKFIEINSLDQLKNSFIIIEEVYKNAGHPLSDLSLFESSLKHLVSKGYLKIFGAETGEGILAATMYVPSFKGRLYEWYVAGLQEYQKKFASDFLIWEIFKYGINNGYSLFDFGGAGSPKKEYGVRDYKKKFGGEFVNFGRFRKIYKPNMFRIGEQGLKIYKKLKSSKSGK
ncbi:hypothetical protein BH10BAC5_BH10BAC5_11600 [soil metagenome]